MKLAVGAGKSIDRTLSIWRRVMHDGGTITLGGNGLPTDVETIGILSKANMDGFVAVPLNKIN